MNKYLEFREKIKEIKEGKNLEEYLHDPDVSVRAEVARQGYGLDILVNDPNYLVRIAVAEQGYGLDKLSSDPNYEVRAKALELLAKDDEELTKSSLVIVDDYNPLNNIVDKNIANEILDRIVKSERNDIIMHSFVISLFVEYIFNNEANCNPVNLYANTLDEAVFAIHYLSSTINLSKYIFEKSYVMILGVMNFNQIISYNDFVDFVTDYLEKDGKEFPFIPLLKVV